ncbi:MAG: hypothetical protein IJ962_02480 [Clostridia bacterium]|nr:hypothetical protein [Clostridia bacterium]MBR2418072.1 hypothetical protein [Clostridia bacterium]
MNYILNLLEVAVIGGADGPTAIFTSGNLPLPAICVSVFGVIFIAYVYIAKAIRRKSLPAEAVATIKAPAHPGANSPAQAVYTGPVLNGIEEQDAAVVMAIVSHKTGIPLNRLKFDSITLKEDK